MDDRWKVLAGGPWSFDNALIVLEEPAGKGAIRSLKFSTAEFWVQISNIPMLCMTMDIGRFLGGIIGEVREVDAGPSRDCLGKFLRVRVAIEIDKPIRRFLRVDVLRDGEETIMPIQYERLPNFCFSCGFLGHMIRDCSNKGDVGDDNGGGGRSEKFNHGGSRRPYNRVADARWYNQHSSMKKGDLRPPEAGAKGVDKGVRIGNHEDSIAKIAGDKCGINLNSNLKEDCTRNLRSSLKGKEVDSERTDSFIFTGGIKEATNKPCGVIGACGEVEKSGVARPLEGFEGLQMSDGLGFVESPSGTELGSRAMGKVPTIGSSGSGVILLSDEGIGPTGHGNVKPQIGKVNGPRKWKKAARMGPLPNCEPLFGDLFGKRQVCTSVDVFSGDHKKPRTDASSDISDGLLSAGWLSLTY
ncbi:hypothetical protein Q3G72_026149 [Acer saccharum]|nr:hypothetical protein Q3G72_026149 [Acer saccharum]